MHVDWLINEIIGAVIITAFYFTYNAGRKAALKQHNIQED